MSDEINEGRATFGEESSIAELEKIVADDPANTDALSWLAYKYFTEERYDQSAAVRELIAEQRPKDLWALFLLANAYAHTGRFEESLRAARTALSYFYQGMFIADLYDRAIETFELIDQRDSDPARKRLACLFAAYASSFAGRYISKMRAERPDVPNEPGLYWYEKALEYPEPRGERDPSELKIHYRAGMEYWRGVGNKEWWRPRLSEEDYWRSPQYEKACRAFERSVALCPVKDCGGELLSEKTHPFEMLSASYVRTGRLAEAIDALQKSLALIPDNSHGWTREQRLGIIIANLDRDASVALSEVYEKVGEYWAAVECIVGREHQTGPIGVLISYERYEEALALIRRAEEIAGKHPVEQSSKIAELRRRVETTTGQPPERLQWLRRFVGSIKRRN